MSDMQDYASSLKDAASRKFETFSYLPTMDADQTRKQVEYIVRKGWNPAVEHTEPENASGSYCRCLVKPTSMPSSVKSKPAIRHTRIIT
jgi:ribulose bisphosphate carboxylase small subunit